MARLLRLLTPFRLGISPPRSSLSLSPERDFPFFFPTDPFKKTLPNMFNQWCLGSQIRLSPTLSGMHHQFVSDNRFGFIRVQVDKIPNSTTAK